MPMKYLPSRVTRSLRGGRHQLRRPSKLGAELCRRSGRLLVTPDGTARVPACGEAVGGTDSGRAGVESPALDSREEEFMAMRRLERYGNPPDDVAHHTLGFFPAWHVAFRMRRKAHAMSQQRHREFLDVVGDTVAPTVQERAGAGSLGQILGSAG